MAMKFRVTKTELEKLAPHYQSEYLEKDGVFVLDIEGGEDTGALKRAKDREKARAKEFEDKLNAAEAELDTLRADPKARDVKSLEASWIEKHNKVIVEKDGAIAKLSDFAKRTLADSVALNLAKEISTSPELLLPHISKRIVADLEGDAPKTKILDKDGKASALTLEDFKKEVLETPAYAAIIIASKAKGSSATQKPASSASPSQIPTDKPADLRNMPVSDLAKRIEARLTARKGA
jgi:hypothetical protein